jgi:hypothetical protein
MSTAEPEDERGAEPLKPIYPYNYPGEAIDLYSGPIGGLYDDNRRGNDSPRSLPDAGPLLGGCRTQRRWPLNDGPTRRHVRSDSRKHGRARDGQCYIRHSRVRGSPAAWNPSPASR